MAIETPIVTGIEYFPNPTIGRPVFNGSVYVGIIDLDPKIEANRITVTVIEEDGTRVAILPSAQPLLTGQGGVIIYNGKPVSVVTDQNYSIRVDDSSGAQVYYVPFVQNIGTVLSFVVNNYSSVESAKNDLNLTLGNRITTTSYYDGWEALSSRPRGGSSYDVVTPAQFTAITGQSSPDGFGDHLAVTGNVLMLLKDYKVTILQYGADPLGMLDISSQANAMYVALPSINGNIIPGTSGVGTMVTPVFPEGKYKVSSTINVRAYSRTKGEDAILVGDPGVTIMDTDAYGVSIYGIIFASGAVGIKIATANVNTSMLTINACEFHNQTIAGIDTDSNSASTISTVERCKFYFLSTGGLCANIDNVGEITFKDNWIKSNSQIGFVVGGSIARFERNVFNPGGDNLLPDGRWFDWLGGIGSQLDIRNNRFGGEGGGAVVVRASATAQLPPNENPSILTIKNNSIFVGTYPVEFYNFPNKIVFEDNFGFNATDGFRFDSSITRLEFVTFAEFGLLSLDHNYPNNIPSELHITNQYIGEQIFICKRYISGTMRINALERLNASDIYATYRIGGGGWSTTGTAPESSSEDEYGIISVEVDPVSDDQSSAISAATFLDPTVILPDKIYTLITIVDAKVLPKEQQLSIVIGGQRNDVFISTKGKTIISTPFVYLNNTGVPMSAYDEIKYLMFQMASGSKIRLSRLILIEGLIEYNNDVVVITGTATPTAFADGSIFNNGYSRGDIQYRSNVSTGSFMGDVNTLQGKPGTWTTWGATT